MFVALDEKDTTNTVGITRVVYETCLIAFGSRVYDLEFINPEHIAADSLFKTININLTFYLVCNNIECKIPLIHNISLSFRTTHCE